MAFKRIIAVVLVSAFLFPWMSVEVLATDLRGRIDSRNVYTNSIYPRAGIEVTLMHWNGVNWMVGQTVLSGADGFYYFQGIAPGDYRLSVNGQLFPLSVANVPYQDIQPILAP